MTICQTRDGLQGSATHEHAARDLCEKLGRVVYRYFRFHGPVKGYFGKRHQQTAFARIVCARDRLFLRCLCEKGAEPLLSIDVWGDGVAVFHTVNDGKVGAGADSEMVDLDVRDLQKNQSAGLIRR